MNKFLNRQPKKLPETLEKNISEKTIKYARVVIALLTIGFICFIWGHSMMPGDTSAEESGFITSLLNSVFGYEVVSEHFIRKTAHFTEYLILGILCLVNLLLCNSHNTLKEGKQGFVGFVYCFFKYLVRFLPALYVCLFVAVADESIQLFTVGRSGSIFDIWLDHMGSLTGYIMGIVVYMFVGLYMISKSVHSEK